MQVLFPNPWAPPAPESEIRALQAHIGFSDAYADFLRTQNGYSLYKMELSGDCAAYVQPSDAVSENRANSARCTALPRRTRTTT
jgi:hypothetical protein